VVLPTASFASLQHNVQFARLVTHLATALINAHTITVQHWGYQTVPFATPLGMSVMSVMLASCLTTFTKAASVHLSTQGTLAISQDVPYVVQVTTQCVLTVCQDISQVEALNARQMYVTFRIVTCVYKIISATNA
jgi:hypothetical protein